MTNKLNEKALITKLAGKTNQHNHFSEEQYKQNNVKRGLRNDDGSGVVAGLTGISSVVGTTKVNDQIMPADGRLIYRGIEIEDIVAGLKAEDRCGFEEITYLLLFGELPDRKESAQFNRFFNSQRDLPRGFDRKVLMNFRSNNLMNMMTRGVLALYAEDPKAEDLSLENQITEAIALIAKFPVIIVHAYHAMLNKSGDHPALFIKPNRKLNTAENFFHMMRGGEEYSQHEVKTLDTLLLLHMDHSGGNNSTFTTRVVTSTGTDIYSACVAGICSLKGPLHGGANKSVMDMMEDIKTHVKDWSNKPEIEQYLLKILRKEAHDGQGKISGFGHPVYTKNDPRAIIIKEFARKLAKEKNTESELELYFNIEEVAPRVFADFKKKDVAIFANVDFYSGFVYKSMGLTEELYTPLFAMARVSGWMAHRLEELFVAKKIIRPGYKGLFEKQAFVALGDR